MNRKMKNLRKIRNLWFQALRGSGKAYRRLGILFWTGTMGIRDRSLARLCLMKAAELGDEEGYFLYHWLFSSRKKVIDDRSYQQICQEYEKETNVRKKKQLERYLNLGTPRQKRLWFQAAKHKHSRGGEGHDNDGVCK
ncbi:MAG: hypothetical protein Q4E24_00100 [bacterium]|nr:hypothetical protein [bacterium]